MNFTMIRNVLVLVAVMVVASASALAGTKGGGALKQKVSIRYDATLDGQHLDRGDYDLEITTEAEPVLILRRGKEEVARTPLTAVDRDKPSAYDKIESRATDDGAAPRATDDASASRAAEPPLPAP